MQLIEEKITKIDQQDIFKITLVNDYNYSISFYNFGGYVHSILIPYSNHSDDQEDVILGYDKFEDYITDTSYFNCIVGRVGGRIANSQFYLNDKKYQLFANDGDHHLHGGQFGFNKKIWNISNIEKNSDEIICLLNYLSSNLEEGYPGDIRCTTKYLFNNNNEFIIEFKAKTNVDTIINLTNHNYWNFHGHNKFYQNLHDHKVKIFSHNYCETDNNLIPTGRIINSKNSKYDFRSFKKIDSYKLQDKGIDIYNILQNYDGTLKEVASAYSDITKMGVRISSDQPGVQFYTGNMMEQSYNGKFKKNYGYQHAFCLEPQFYPDAINQTNFKSPVLHKNNQYVSTIVMQLENNFNE